MCTESRNPVVGMPFLSVRDAFTLRCVSRRHDGFLAKLLDPCCDASCSECDDWGVIVPDDVSDEKDAATLLAAQMRWPRAAEQIICACCGSWYSGYRGSYPTDELVCQDCDIEHWMFTDGSGPHG